MSDIIDFGGQFCSAAIVFLVTSAWGPGLRRLKAWAADDPSSGSPPPGEEGRPDRLRALAEAGDSDAQYWMGRRYDDADPRDPVEAVKWYLKAAKKGFQEAVYRLKAMSREGDGVPPDVDEAERWLYRQLYQRTGERAGSGLAPGWRPPANGERRLGATPPLNPPPNAAPGAPQWGGVPMWVLASDLASGKTPLKILKKGAAGGDPQRLWQLGLANLTGEEVPKNFKRAAKLFRRAAESGSNKAACNLGVMLIQGFGIMADVPEGLRLIRKAAAEGCLEALYNLYVAYRGRCLLSAEEARECLTKAADAGFPPAMRELEKYRVK
jgi:TPR repeat protein